MMKSSITSRLVLLSILLLTTLSLSCGKSKARSLRGAEYFYEEGMQSLERKRYLEAVESFQRVVSNFPGSSLICDAQYYLAETYFRMDDYVNAVFEYQRLVDAYPTCSWADRAEFQIGESFFQQMRRPELDQKETHEAIRFFRRFIEDNPQSPLIDDARQRIQDARERLAIKQRQAAQLYYRQGYLKAARITYEFLLREYPETSQHCVGLKALGDVERREGNPEKARFYWELAISDCTDEALLRDIHIWLSELEDGG